MDTLLAVVVLWLGLRLLLRLLPPDPLLEPRRFEAEVARYRPEQVTTYAVRFRCVFCDRLAAVVIGADQGSFLFEVGEAQAFHRRTFPACTGRFYIEGRSPTETIAPFAVAFDV